MMQLTILKGMQGSGKTKFIETIVGANKIKIIRINRSDVQSRIDILTEKIKFWIECINNRSILEEA